VKGLTILDSRFEGVTRGSLIQGLEDLVMKNVVIAPAQAQRPGSQGGQEARPPY
jgi:hypothetical protein